MALDAPTIAGLILGVLGLFGMSMMYKFSKTIWKTLSGRIWPRRNRADSEEGLPITSTTPQFRVATSLATSPISTRTMHPAGISSTGGVTRPRSHIDPATSRERQQDAHPITIHSVPSLPSLPVDAPEYGLQSVTAKQHDSLRPSTLRATSTAVSSLSTSSARNRHYGVMASASPVSAQDTIPVTNAPDLQSTPPFFPVVIIPETTADPPTTVPEEQHAMHKTRQALTDSTPCYPSTSPVSAPIIHGIRIVRPSPALVRPFVPTVNMDAMDHNDLAGVPQESNIYTPAEPVTSVPPCLIMGESPSSTSPDSRPVETPVGLATLREVVEEGQKDAGGTENESPLRSTRSKARLPTAAAHSQLLPEPQQPPDRVSSTSSDRHIGSVTATTDSASSGTSAAAETTLASVSSHSDRQGQQQVVSLRDGRLQAREGAPAGDEVDPTDRPTEVGEVTPDRGPTTGGVRIIITGKNFPSTQLYVRFGDFITFATWGSREFLRCTLPPASRAGIVKVTLSQAPSQNCAEFGRSFAHFEYEDSRVITLYSLLKMVLEKHDGRSLENVLTSIQQCLAVAIGSNMDANVHTTPEHGKGLTTALDFQVAELEGLSIRFLSAHSRATNWKKTVSLQNEYGQTMAHIAVMLGYLQLLRSLVDWGIDINLTDLKGSTALHYAFLCNESACAVFLIRSGADELALDELGRSAWELNPSLVDEFASRLPGISKFDGSFSVSCRPAEGEWEMEPPEEAAELRAKYLLIQRWLQRMDEEHHSADCLRDGHLPRSRTLPPCYPGYENDSDLNIQETSFGSAYPDRSEGMTQSKPPGPHGMQVGRQPIGVPPPYSEQDETHHGQSPGSAVVTSPTDATPPTLFPATDNQSPQLPSSNVKLAKMDGDLYSLEKKINASAWLRHNILEPCIGDRDCPTEAETCGARGQSVYTAFVKIQGGDIYGCKYEACRAYSLDEAVRHQRHYDFIHSPYVCQPTSGNICGRRFACQVDLMSHQQKCPM